MCTRRYAEYFVRFVQDYQRKGVLVNYLTLQNEPSHGGVPVSAQCHGAKHSFITVSKSSWHTQQGVLLESSVWK